MNQFAPASKIIVKPNRQRSGMDVTALGDLADSIEKTQLLHAVVCRVEGEDLVLVAGERRLNAIGILHEEGRKFLYNGERVMQGFVPFVTLGQLSLLEAQRAEYEENLRRVDLTWEDEARASAALQQLMSAEAEAVGEKPPTLKAVVERLKEDGAPVGQSTVADQLNIVRFLDDPDVRKAKSLSDAKKVVQKKLQGQQNAALAASLGREVVAASHQLFHGDCLEWLGKCADGVFDVVLSDPPYGMGADEFGDSGGKAVAEHQYDDSLEAWCRLMEELPEQLFRVVKPNAHAYLFCDLRNFKDLKGLMTVSGWRVFPTPLIWHKPNAYRAPWPGAGPQRRYECILYAMKGDRLCQKMGGDVLTFPPDENLGHNAQKPVALFEELLSRSARPGDKVLDPFCGSGTIFEAAQKAKVLATGIELSQQHYGLAAKRLQGLKGQA